MCHSENRYGDKQNKNRWSLQNVNTTWKIDAATNRTKTIGARGLWLLLGKQMPYVHIYNISGACKSIHWEMCHM